MEKKLKKRFLLVTQYFYPENFKSNDIAFELASRGYKVDALVSIPNYPEGKYYKGYNLIKKRFEKYKNVNIYRCFQTPRGRKAKSFFLALNYLSYLVSASIWALFFALFKKYDGIIVHATSPITQAIPAIIVKKVQRIPLYTWVLDIWPDAMTSGGGIKNKSILSFMNNMVKWIYSNSDKILISSKGFEDLIVKQDSKFKEKITYFPNWTEDVIINNEIKIPLLPDGFKILMAGNLGKAQNIRELMKAILLFKDYTELKWIFIGDGSEKNYIDNFLKENNLENTVFTYGRYPSEYMGGFFNQADALLITLRAEFPHLRAVIPARLQSYMAAGKPILGMADGGVNEIIKEADCGYCVNANDYKAFYNIIKTNILSNKNTLAIKGKNGRKYYEKHFTKKYCIDNLEKILTDD